MNPYMNKPSVPQPNFNQGGDRFFFFPFLTGALVGGAAIGLTRPRPVYVNPAPYPQYGYGGYPMGSGYNYGNQGYYYYR